MSAWQNAFCFIDTPLMHTLGALIFDNLFGRFPDLKVATIECGAGAGRPACCRVSTSSGGFITGSTESKQFQVLRGPQARIWSVAVGTRNLERAHERCAARGIPCSDMQLVPWGDGQGIRAFFAEVGGIVFEVMRVERTD
jgi:hypothetical protein